jgi:hypothetical protein
MAVEIRVVQKPGQTFLTSMFLGPGNFALWCDQYFKDATPISSVDDLVDLVLRTAASQGKIDFIQINGHGNQTGFRIGEDWIDIVSLETFRPKLVSIASSLSRNCSVEVSACEAGRAKGVLQRFSQILGGISIVGYSMDQTGGLSPSGPPVIVTPGGAFSPAAPAAGSSVAPPPPPPPGR